MESAMAGDPKKRKAKRKATRRATRKAKSSKRDPREERAESMGYPPGSKVWTEPDGTFRLEVPRTPDMDLTGGIQGDCPMCGFHLDGPRVFAVGAEMGLSFLTCPRCGCVYPPSNQPHRGVSPDGSPYAYFAVTPEAIKRMEALIAHLNSADVRNADDLANVLEEQLPWLQSLADWIRGPGAVWVIDKLVDIVIAVVVNLVMVAQSSPEPTNLTPEQIEDIVEQVEREHHPPSGVDPPRSDQHPPDDQAAPQVNG
jgi:hypothetical protein